MIRPNTRQKAKSASKQAPVGGWNARDSIAAMGQMDAVYLTNWWPTTTDLMIRQGTSDHATGLPDLVETIMPYISASGAPKLFAASDAGIYDVSAAGAVGAAAVSGLTSAQFQYVQFSTTAGNYLYCVNGSDKPQLYTGSAWVAVDGASTPAITGVTTTSLIHVNVFKQRLFFIEKASLNAWYLPVLSIGGAASKLDFTSVFRRGGHLVAMGTWSIDGGYGMDDYAVWVSSEGEAVVYRGTDPSSSTDWSLVGIYQLGAPIGRKCMTKFGGDLLIITRDGIMPMSAALQSTRVDPRAAITDKIQQAVSDSIAQYGSNYGWEITLFPEVDMVLLNVPAGDGVQVQYAMNAITKSWAAFAGMPANCWETFNRELYYGGDGVVVKAWTGYSDNGNNIVADGLAAFDTYRTSTSNKFFTMVRPILSVGGGTSYGIAVHVDYEIESTLTLLSVPPTTLSKWDVGKWDSAKWASGTNFIKRDWAHTGVIGYSAALRIQAISNQTSVRWVGYDMVYQYGGIL